MLNDRRWIPLLTVLAAGLCAARSLSAQDALPREGLPAVQRESCAARVAGSRPAWPESLPDPYGRWREWMALGRCHAERGEAALAEGYFREGALHAPALEPAWPMSLLRAAISGGRPDQAQRLIAALAANPAGGLRPTMRNLLTQAWSRDNPEWRQAVLGIVSAYIAAVEPEPEDYDLLLALAEHGAPVMSPAGRPPSLLLWRYPKNEPSARRWEEARQAGLSGFPPPSAEDFLARCRQLRRLRLHALLREEFDPERLPELEPEAARAIGQNWFWALGRGRYFTQALRALDSETARQRFALTTRDVLSLAVEFHLRAGQADAALERLEALEQEAPQAFVLPGYYLDLSRRARLRGDTEDMERWARRVLERFPDHPRASEAFWLPVWENFRRGRFQESANWAEAFLAANPEDGGRDRFLYWLGRAYSGLDRPQDRARVWNHLVAEFPAGFYSYLAQGEALEAVAEPIAVPPESAGGVAPPELEAIWGQPPLHVPLLLMLLGEDTLGEAALDAAIAAPGPLAAAEAALRELADALVHLRKYHLAQKLAARLLRPASAPGSASDLEILRRVYPLAYWEQIADGQAQRLSPFFVLAVIREESHFREDADSSAGAKGLMQLLPSTAAAVAKDNGLPQDEDSLLRPDVNIALGKLYLEGLRKRFGGNPLHIAAGYNAGPTVVRQWLRSFGDLPPDEFVEAIPFEETQNYVKKVLATSILYRRLYAGR
jgi:soluble lytic murein transglycosylase